MPEMIKVGHRQNSRAGRAKDFEQQPEDMLMFGRELIEHGGVIIAPGRGGLEGRRHVLQRARDVENHTLPPEFSLRHRLPVSREPFISRAPRPNVAKPLRFLLVAQQFRSEVGIAEILDLETLVFVEGRQQETEFILKCVKVRRRAVQEIGGLEDESLRHVAAAPKVVEHDQVADKMAVGSALEHESGQFAAGCPAAIPDSWFMGASNSRTQIPVTQGSATADLNRGGDTARTRTT